MNFKQYLKEEFLKMKKVKTGLVDVIYEVYKNPSRSEINQISNKFFELNGYSPKGLSKALRGLVDLNNGYLYVWNANLLHTKAIESFNLNPNGLRLVFNPQKRIIEIAELAYDGTFDPKVLKKQAIDNLLNTGYEILEYIDFSDETNDNSKIKYNLKTGELTRYESDEDY